MTIKGSKQRLLIGDVLLKGEAVILVLLLEAWLPACSGHAGHGAGHALCTLQAFAHHNDGKEGRTMCFVWQITAGEVSSEAFADIKSASVLG